MPDGPQGQHGQTNSPAHDYVARQRLGESFPVKLERYQNLRDNDGRENQYLSANLLAITAEQKCSR